MLLLALALGSAPLGSDNVVTTTDPIELFEQMCSLDIGQMSGQVYRAAHPEEVPDGARRALALAMTELKPPYQVVKLVDEDFLNVMYTAKPGGELFLIFPVRSTLPMGGTAAECAVIWHKAEFARAAAEQAAFASKYGGQAITTGDLPHVLYHSQGYTFGAAENDGWTVLRMVNDADVKPRE